MRKFEHSRLLPAGDFEGLIEAGFSPFRVRAALPERNTAVEAIQVGKPITVPGLQQKRGFLQHCLATGHIPQSPIDVRRIGDVLRPPRNIAMLSTVGSSTTRAMA
jgi:hypothetical protein